MIDGVALRGGTQPFLTDERLGKAGGRLGGDQRALVQTERDKSLPRKGQVY